MDAPLCHYSCQTGAARTKDALWPGPSEVQADFTNTSTPKITRSLQSWIPTLLIISCFFSHLSKFVNRNSCPASRRHSQLQNGEGRRVLQRLTFVLAQNCSCLPSPAQHWFGSCHEHLSALAALPLQAGLPQSWRQKDSHIQLMNFLSNAILGSILTAHKNTEPFETWLHWWLHIYIYK